MSDELERLLREAFDAQARSGVRDDASPPAARYLVSDRQRHRRWLAPVAAAAAVVAVVASVLAVQPGSDERNRPVAGGPTVQHTSHTSAAPSAAPVHIKLLNSDGAQYGVGMPVIAFFSRPITSGKALQDATKVVVSGEPLSGAWYFERSSYYKSYPIEAHWRPETYWPAHAKIAVDIAAKGKSAGAGMTFDDSLTLNFVTGARNIAVVNDVTHQISVSSDGKPRWVFPVSLGAGNSPTSRGTKVIMEKGRSLCMSGPGYHQCGVKFTQRLTYGGEYLNAAPWNEYNIAHGIDTSNGCTNLLPKDADTLFHSLLVGDIVQYPNAPGPAMTLGAGYGDWNVDWSTWQRGGLISTR